MVGARVVGGVLFFLTMSLVNIATVNRTRRNIGICLLGNVISSAAFSSFRGFIFDKSGLIVRELSNSGAAMTVSSIRGVVFNSFGASASIRGIQLTNILICRSNDIIIISDRRTVHSMILVSLSKHVVRGGDSVTGICRCNISIGKLIGNICLVAIRARRNTAGRGIIVG